MEVPRTSESRLTLGLRVNAVQIWETSAISITSVHVLNENIALFWTSLRAADNRSCAVLQFRKNHDKWNNMFD